MNATLDKPELWSYREAAALMGLTEANGYRVISALVDRYEIPHRKVATAICIDRAGLEAIAQIMRVDLNESRSSSYADARAAGQ